MERIQRIIAFIGDVARTFGGLLDLLSLLAGSGTGVVALLALLSHQPPSFFIILGIVTALLVSLAIVRIAYRYKRWDKVLNQGNPRIVKILRVVLDMYLEENKIARRLGEDMPLERVNTIFPKDIWDIFGINETDIPVMQDTPTKAEIKAMTLVVGKLLKFSMNAKWVARLIDFGGVFEREKQGIKTYPRVKNTKYPALENDLRNLRLEFPTHSKELSKVIDNTLYYSYVLNTILLFAIVITKTREAKESFPIAYLARFKTYELAMEGLFNQRLEILKKELKKAIVKATEEG